MSMVTVKVLCGGVHIGGRAANVGDTVEITTDHLQCNPARFELVKAVAVAKEKVKTVKK